MKSPWLHAVIAIPIILFQAEGSPSRPQGSLPPFLEPNRGQFPGSVEFALQSSAMAVSFEAGGIRYEISGPLSTSTLRVRFLGGQKVHPIGTEELPGRVSYLIGENQAQWRTDVPTYATVSYSKVWPGIDVRYSVETGSLKSEFIVAPWANPGAVRWSVEGADNLEIASDGSLVIRSEWQKLCEGAPAVFERDRVTGNLRKVRGGFRLFPDRSVGIEVADYDRNNELVFDPVIGFSTFLGGSGQSAATAVAADPNGNAVVAGYTTSLDFAAGAVSLGPVQRTDAFVAKLNVAGNQLIFCTYVGGIGDDRALAVAVDRWSNVYVAGTTASNNFPVVRALQPQIKGPRNAFVFELNPSGTDLTFSTFWGGSVYEQACGIAVSRIGDIYITGDTQSPDFPIAGGFQGTLGGGQDAFITEFGPSGSSLRYSSYFGGLNDEHAAGIAVDSLNEAVVAGYTLSTNLTVVNPFQPHSGGNQDAFVTKVNAKGTALVFSTYAGGTGGTPGLPETAGGVAVDWSGAIYVTGSTSSVNFPVTPGAFQSVAPGGSVDAFVIKLTSAGALVYGTYLGGSSYDYGNSIAVDEAGNAHVAGYTLSADYPVLRGPQQGNNGSYDLFVTKLNSTGTSLVYSTLWGGASSDSAAAIAIDKFGAVLVAGQTYSPDFPVQSAYQTALQGVASSIVMRIPIGWQAVLFTNGQWSIDTLSNGGSNGQQNSFFSATQGQPGDIPVSGDWTNTGLTRFGLFYNGSWSLDLNADWAYTSADRYFTWGQAGDVPITGDWNGTGTVKAGLFRNGTFLLDLSGHLSGVPTGLSDLTFPFGMPGDIPVVGDWNGSGKTNIGVFRAGTWYLDIDGDHLLSGNDLVKTYGQPGDIPVVGDWDGSGVSKPGLYRNGVFLLDYNGNWNIDGYGDLTVPFGPPPQYAFMAK